MAAAKSALKAAKAALDKQDFPLAATEARKVVEADQQNYYGHLFLGRALEKQNQLSEAVETYNAAASIKPDDELGWKGLCNAYEALGPKGVEGYLHAALELSKIYVQKDDAYQCQSTIDKLVDTAWNVGTREQYKQALHAILPGSPVFDFLEGRIPNPALTFAKLAEITENEEKEKINKDIGERRTRLGANLSQVTLEVKREIFSKSELETLYREVISWSMDDGVRRSFEEKLYQRALDYLIVLPKADKAEKRAQVMQMARDMVIIKHPFQPAWELTLEWDDLDDLKSLDANILREFIQFFPAAGLSKVFQGYLGESREQQNDKSELNGDEEETEHDTKEQVIVRLSDDDCLLLIIEGLEKSKKSPLAHRIGSQHYLQIEEYESCIDTARQGLTLVDSEARKSGLKLELSRDAFNLSLATSLVYYQSPKNHPEASAIFDEILKRKPDSTNALLGTGLILEERAEYQEASAFLDKAFARDPQNVRIGVESAWCKVLTGELEAGLEALETCLENFDPKGPADLKSLILYRIGKALWELKPEKASRKDRNGAYQRFISSLKANPNFAPAYTSLGIYYSDYSKDKKRARQCFQKAFDLSASEVESAERLARAFADEAEWDIVEIIAQRVIDSGIVRPAPGSKKKGISWPFAALGIVQMNKQEYPKSVISFQSALRISPSDFNSWVGLGESYHSSGRYIAAQRALEHALSLANSESSNGANETWFAEYMLSNVLRELGEYDSALDGYRKVSQARPNEFGVMISLLQTLIEKSWHCLESGFFGRAAESGVEAIQGASEMLEQTDRVFNFWKAVGDVCALFSSIPGYVAQFPLTQILNLFADDHVSVGDSELDFDGITASAIKTAEDTPDEENFSKHLESILFCTIMAYKMAIRISSDDKHAQAVAWYNLGWAEYRARISIQKLSRPAAPKTISRFGKAAVRCFKKAIELEAGNADFWNALGVATTGMNGRVAQHSFVRSLHLNSRSARTWTNLGTLYLVENDHELAHTAFARAQSADPDFAHAWVGEGLIALALGYAHEALSHFTHAMEIADASSKSAKSHYVVAAYDNLLQSSTGSANISEAVQAIFSLQQLLNQALRTSDLAHLNSLLQERVGDYEGAVKNLEKVCEDLETKYEETEDPKDLGRFAVAKSDLARNRAALGDFGSSSEDAETALDLLSDEDSGGLSKDQLTKARLSAHLTAGLAKHHLGEADEAIDMFRAALVESDADPDVVCLLAQVLWAKGGENEQNVAKEQLFECIEKNPGHAQATQLIGAMAAVENDESTKDAVMADLQQMRTSDQLSELQKRSTESLLSILTQLESSQSGDEAAAVAKAATPIMLTPFLPDSWNCLAEVSKDRLVADMALKAAIQSAPPRGELDSRDLSKAFANAPSIANAQKAIALQPWEKYGWQSLQECAE